MPSKNAKKLPCVVCGQLKRSDQVNAHCNELLNNKFVVCKDCCSAVDFGSDDEILAMCRLMNKPYIVETVRDYRNQGKGFPEYLRWLAPNTTYRTYEDSVFKVEKPKSSKPKTNTEEEVMAEILDGFEITDEMRARWGFKLAPLKYYEYEKSLENLRSLKEPGTPFEMKRYIQNVKMEISLNDALADNDPKTITTAQKTYNADLKALGLDKVVDREDKEESLGERIKRWEEHGPVPEIDDELSDVDNIKGYVTKWFIRPMKRVLGLATEEEVASLYDDET
jgi:hypothetical protein